MIKMNFIKNRHMEISEAPSTLGKFRTTTFYADMATEEFFNGEVTDVSGWVYEFIGKKKPKKGDML